MLLGDFFKMNNYYWITSQEKKYEKCIMGEKSMKRIKKNISNKKV